MYNTSNSGENRIRGDKMRQDKISKVLKSKGFYLSLLTGVLAVVVVCFVYFNTNTGNKQNNNLTDLNNNNVAQSSEKPSDKPKGTDNANVAKTTPKPDDGQQANANNNDSLLENDIYKDPSKEETDKESVKKDDSVAASTNKTKALKLDYTGSDFAWPVSGKDSDVIIDYDVESPVLFATLKQYKCSDAIVIKSEVGTKVKSATNAKVLSIKENEETGKTVTVDLGNGYNLVYGQLKNVKVEKGDYVKAGAVIGEIAEPTMYYVVEGPNLYFKMTLNEQTVNPMYYLQ